MDYPTEIIFKASGASKAKTISYRNYRLPNTTIKHW